jgi:hypothetical protein
LSTTYLLFFLRVEELIFSLVISLAHNLLFRYILGNDQLVKDEGFDVPFHCI